jgi:hypothetical protein
MSERHLYICVFSGYVNNCVNDAVVLSCSVSLLNIVVVSSKAIPDHTASHALGCPGPPSAERLPHGKLFSVSYGRPLPPSSRCSVLSSVTWGSERRLRQHAYIA